MRAQAGFGLGPGSRPRFETFQCVRVELDVTSFDSLGVGLVAELPQKIGLWVSPRSVDTSP
jgi:hypothetical protein